MDTSYFPLKEGSRKVVQQCMICLVACFCSRRWKKKELMLMFNTGHVHVRKCVWPLLNIVPHALVRVCTYTGVHARTHRCKTNCSTVFLWVVFCFFIELFKLLKSSPAQWQQHINSNSLKQVFKISLFNVVNLNFILVLCMWSFMLSSFFFSNQ